MRNRGSNASGNALRNAMVNAPEPEQKPDTRHQNKCLPVAVHLLANPCPASPTDRAHEDRQRR